jgi:hypothetical protein
MRQKKFDKCSGPLDRKQTTAVKQAVLLHWMTSDISRDTKLDTAFQRARVRVSVRHAETLQIKERLFMGLYKAILKLTSCTDLLFRSPV